MDTIFNLTADKDNERADAFVSRSLNHQTRSYWQKVFAGGGVSLNGEPIRAGKQLKAGQSLVIALPQPHTKTGQVPILYEDDDVLVADKPAGMLTHAKGSMSDEYTVADFIRPRTTDEPVTNRSGIVHRLDRGTSGVIILAKNKAARQWLQKQFSQRKVKKTYIALVNGVPLNDSALINLPIERNPRKPQTFRVSPNGKSALTEYKVIGQFSTKVLLEMQPRTGRTHQLRVHAAALRTPIVGDQVYGIKDPLLARPFLHAARLEVTLPNRQHRVFEAPLPAELAAYLERQPHA